MRSCTVHFRKVQGTEWPIGDSSADGPESLPEIFRRSGIHLDCRFSSTDLAAHPRGFPFDLTDLHRLLTQPDPSRVTLNSPGSNAMWTATVLVVPSIAYLTGRTVRRPLGVMFDVGAADLNHVPREGCAVAWNAVRHDTRVYKRTIAHELGHVFNLRHPPEDYPPVTQGNTLMFETRDLMRDRAFPANIVFEFSSPHQDWLANGPDEYVRPGGVSFGQRPGQGTVLTIVDPPADPGLADLRLAVAKQSHVPWEPIELEARLTALGPEPLNAIDLDPAGGLSFVEYRQTGNGIWKIVPPVVRECGVELQSVTEGCTLVVPIRLPGLCLAKPGSIEVRLNSIIRDGAGRQWLKVSNRVRCSVERPITHQYETLSQLFRNFPVRLGCCWRSFLAVHGEVRDSLERVFKETLPQALPAPMVLAAARTCQKSADAVQRSRGRTMLIDLQERSLTETLRQEVEQSLITETKGDGLSDQSGFTELGPDPVSSSLKATHERLWMLNSSAYNRERRPLANSTTSR
jgi:hypothetical protein